MRAAHLGRGAEHAGVALQLPVALAEHVAGKDHPRVGRAPHAADVVVGVGGAAYHDELHPAAAERIDAAERLDEHVRVVLGLEPSDEQHVAVALEAELLEHAGAVVSGILDAVGDDADLAARTAERRSRPRRGCR